MLAGWVVVLTVGVNLFVVARLADEADDLLRTEAQVTADTIHIGPDGSLVIPKITNDAALDVGTWIFHGTDIIQGPADSRNLDDQAVQLTNRGQTFDQTGGSEGVRWYAEPIMSGQQQVGTVVTALSLVPTNRRASTPSPAPRFSPCCCCPAPISSCTPAFPGRCVRSRR